MVDVGLERPRRAYGQLRLHTVTPPGQVIGLLQPSIMQLATVVHLSRQEAFGAHVSLQSLTVLQSSEQVPLLLHVSETEVLLLLVMLHVLPDSHTVMHVVELEQSKLHAGQPAGQVCMHSAMPLHVSLQLGLQFVWHDETRMSGSFTMSGSTPMSSVGIVMSGVTDISPPLV